MSQKITELGMTDFKFTIGDLVVVKSPNDHPSRKRPFPNRPGKVFAREAGPYSESHNGWEHQYDILWEGAEEIDTAGWFEWALEYPALVEYEEELKEAELKWLKIL